MFGELAPASTPTLPENFSFLEILASVGLLLARPLFEACGHPYVYVGRHHEAEALAHGLEAEGLYVVDLLEGVALVGSHVSLDRQGGED